jgi:multidrug efflux system membrane fusion protein
VELGPPSKGLRIVLNGVSEGETIVVDGVQKATEDALVNPKPAPVPALAN